MTPIEKDEDKLIPEWGRNSNDQVLFAGLAVVVVLFGIFGWRTFFGDDDDVAAPGVTNPVESAQPDTSEPVEVELGDSVQVAVAGLPGDITGTQTSAAATLEGFVANEPERTKAGEVALAVEGVESVTNNLKLLEPPVTDALTSANVASPNASGVGTIVTVTGTVENAQQRTQALGSAAAVAGVTEVVDELNLVAPDVPEQPPETQPPVEVEDEAVSIAEQLNQLPQVQFDYAAATITPASSGDLDNAAALLSQLDETYTGSIEVQGYTDTTGNAASNQQLSEDRSAAVRASLVDRGVPEALLVSKGYGPTSEFGESLAANRLVRFEAIN